MIILEITRMPAGGGGVIVADIRALFGLYWVGYAVRSIGVGNALGHRCVKLGYGAVIFPAVVREAIMPQNIVLHERNSPALDGVCDNNRRLACGI